MNKAKFHIDNLANLTTVKCGNQNSYINFENVHDNPKLNVWCAVLQVHVIGPYSFEENMITGYVYHMLR